MLIQWVTKNAPTPTVKYGLTSGKYTNANVVRFESAHPSH